MTKLSSSLPNNSDENGLDSLNAPFTMHPDQQHIVVAVLDCKTITTDVDTGFQIATARILRVEPLKGREAEQAEQLLQHAMERRTGVKAITGLENILRDGVGLHIAGMTVNPDTGEVDD